MTNDYLIKNLQVLQRKAEGRWQMAEGKKKINKNFSSGFKAQFKQRCFSRRAARGKTASLLQYHYE
ncbi:MAG: hypothetical protein RMZ43_035220 [Nostoc sp. CmiVER01]|uniref:hypothetical protein n=1 Tax=Nostoc sp. CmiVER01 TaxID=3075384 RepID=UPI002AD2121C|nr:hypothetical protein [Nostoc sp. CmiVER01]MDZ8126003.1 hypothetical protein [Nostoc sp. CmiVER01]